MKKKRKVFFGVAMIFIMVIFNMIGCDNDPGGGPDGNKAPTVTSVNVSPKTPAVVKGQTQQFTATVEGTNNPVQTVTWKIETTGINAGTTINSAGLLTVAAAETLTSLTVKATSTVDASKSDTAAVGIYDSSGELPTVTGVTVSPKTADVAKGGTKTFAATVTVTNNAAQTVTWKIETTGINDGTTINSAGLLTVAAAETKTSLTIKATSTVDNTKSDTATVTVTAASTGTPATPQPFNDITAAELVAGIRVGWNLGNTLEAYDNGEGWLPPTSSVQQLETAWGNPVTTKANITAIKNAGFNAIRLPVTWTKAASGAPNYTIRADWMARIVEVVNYAVDNDMYILLNTHHDEEHVYGFLNSDAAAGQAAYGKIWEQIADTFKNYNEKLIFEGLNEPRTKGSANEWSGGTPEEHSNLNAYYQIFVDKVRASGGNNGKRILQINTYASRYEAAAVDGLVLPTDTAANKLIAAFHMYEPFTFCYNQTGSVAAWSADNPSDTATINQAMDRWYNKFVQNGIPVIIGECGTQNKNNTSARAAWTEYYFGYAWSKGIKCFLFDNGLTAAGGSSAAEEAFGVFKRSNNTFDYPEIVAALLEGTSGEQGGFTPSTDPIVVNNPAFVSAWGASATVGADGWITWQDTSDSGGSGALIAYAFPAGWNSYSTIIVTYEIRNVNTAVGANACQLVIKRPKNGEMYTLLDPNYGTISDTGGNNAYPWLDSSGGTLTIDRVAANFDSCIGFQLNKDGYGYDIRITKVEFHN